MLDHPDTIGLIDYTSYLQHKNALRLVKIAGKTPDFGNHATGRLAAQSPAVVLYNGRIVAKQSAELRGFLTYYLTHLSRDHPGGQISTDTLRSGS